MTTNDLHARLRALRDFQLTATHRDTAQAIRLTREIRDLEREIDARREREARG
jgi:hypothetical protein